MTRFRLTALASNTIFPPEFRKSVVREIEALPRYSNIGRLDPRCAVAGRSNMIVQPYRMCRQVFRALADHNQLAGVQRAMWSYSSPWGGRHEGNYKVPISTGPRKWRKKYKYTY